MHRSSESIAALAAALAKAQTELSNPEKSLVGTIGTERPGEGARSVRSARKGQERGPGPFATPRSRAGWTSSARRSASSRSRPSRRRQSMPRLER